MPIVYLDNCCYNRPYDTQKEETIKLETEAKLYIQELIKQGILNLVWSFILDFENNANPFIEQKESIFEWKKIAEIYVPALDDLRIKANQIQKMTGLKAKDSLHVACALFAKADYLITTDKKMLKTGYEGVTIINPVNFVFKISEEELE
ncbi:MAG: PIN domain protein [Leptospiraceae bacterium]|nr:PIN domain protein [Leptospiraceae bacterium]